MTPAARVAATIELLEAVSAESGRPADAVVSAYFRQRRFIGSKDRSALAERLYGLLRMRARIDWWLKRADHPPTARARVIGGLMLAEAVPAAEVARLFSGGRHAAETLDGEERALVKALDSRTLEHPDMSAGTRAECPDWAAGPLQALFGDRFATELAALLTSAPLDLRVNTLKAERESVRAALAAAGIQAEATPLSPIGLRVAGRPPLAGLPLFKAGQIEVQDEGSQLVAALVDPKPGQQVIDFCAGAGGKALALAARMEGRGRVVAADISKGRLIRAKERLRRAGIDNVEPRLLATERDRWVSRVKGKFDRVLIDAPCSGTGAWRRNPDSRWRPVDLAELTGLQSRILASAARLTKPGGRLVYATCSLLREENEAVVEAFLAEHPEYRVLPMAEVWAAALPTPWPGGEDDRALRLTPARHGTDGFFAMVLERLPDESPDGEG